jgi:hypothetical protein
LSCQNKSWYSSPRLRIFSKLNTPVLISTRNERKIKKENRKKDPF